MSFKPTIVPKYISPELKRACIKVANSDDVSFIEIDPCQEYLPNKCAWNAKAEAEKINGQVVFGWAIYVWEEVMYDFIGHAIVLKDGRMRCVTPSKYNESKLAFVPDSRIEFDFSSPNSRMPSKDVPISKRIEVKELLDIQKEMHEIKLKYPVTSGQIALSLEDSSRMRILQQSHKAALDKVIYFHHPVKNQCPCGSSKQFRKCCRPHMQRAFG